MQVLQQLARIFQSDEMSFSLMDILITGFCQRDIYEKIPDALYGEIDSILPSDKQLNLKDSVFESRLVEEEDDRDKSRQTLKNKKQPPMSLLRIPSDLQCHLFAYLHFKELANVQNVCRALCIAARNPSAVYALECNFQWSKKCPFQNECFSRPRMLNIRSCNRLEEDCFTFIGNEKWGHHVVDLRIMRYSGIIDVKFQKLKKCEIVRYPSALLSGSITCYHTLHQLTLVNIKLTDDVVDQIQKFDNLEKLYLRDLYNVDRLEHAAPISLPKLKLFSYQIPSHGFRVFQRFLIGSNPETVFHINAGRFGRYPADSISEFPITQLPAIKQLNISGNDQYFFEAMSLWLRGSQISGTKVFGQVNVIIDGQFNDRNLTVMLPPLITVLQYSNKSKLDLDVDPLCSITSCNMGEVVNHILNAPFGTFNEIRMEIIFPLLDGCQRDEDELYIKYLLDKLDAEKNSDQQQDIVHNVVTESIDNAEKWIEPWMLFNQERMKQIGLEKLDITFGCNLKLGWDPVCLWDDHDAWDAKVKLFEANFNEMIKELMKAKVEQWNGCGRDGVTAANGSKDFAVTLFLEEYDSN